MPSPKNVDEWIWGKETLIWGANPKDQYTFKVLEPKVGKLGMLSLQYHHEKSETWFQLRGKAWALVVVGDQVCTRIMTPMDIQNLPCGTIHRLMGLTNDCQVLEPSTPDRHAADKTVVKDVIRLDCVLGREVSVPTDELQKKVVQQAKEISLKAISDIENGKLPEEINLDLLLGNSAFSLS